MDTHEQYFVTLFAGGLFPKIYVEPKVLAQSQQFLEEHSDSPYYLTRPLIEANDGLARALRIRASLSEEIENSVAGRVP